MLGMAVFDIMEVIASVMAAVVDEEERLGTMTDGATLIDGVLAIDGATGAAVVVTAALVVVGLGFC